MTQLLLTACGETLLMVTTATALAGLLGIGLGLLLIVCEPAGIRPCPRLAAGLGLVVNTLRSVPFVILMVIAIPLTRALVGTSIGTQAAIVPLVIAAAPFVARLAETAFRSVDRGTIEAVVAMGATPWQIVTRVYLPEALPELVQALTVTGVNLIGYSAMAGVIGGGGLGDLAIRFGYQRFRTDVMLWTVAVMIALVQAVQLLGDRLYRGLSRR